MTTTPARILNINGQGSGAGGWWNLGIGFRSSDPESGTAGHSPKAKHVDTDPTPLETYNRPPYFVPNADGSAVQFEVFCHAGTSRGSHNPRSELREMTGKNKADRAAWDGSHGTHAMTGKTRVMQQATKRPGVVVAQIHDAKDDCIELMSTGASWVLRVRNKDGEDDTLPIETNVPLKTEASWTITVSKGVLTVTFMTDGAAHVKTPYNQAPPFQMKGLYFKAGCYGQASVTKNKKHVIPDSEDAFYRVELRDLKVTHTAD
jgi:hypothetical protein